MRVTDALPECKKNARRLTVWTFLSNDIKDMSRKNGNIVNKCIIVACRAGVVVRRGGGRGARDVRDAGVAAPRAGGGARLGGGRALGACARARARQASAQARAQGQARPAAAAQVIHHFCLFHLWLLQSYSDLLVNHFDKHVGKETQRPNCRYRIKTTVDFRTSYLRQIQFSCSWLSIALNTP